MLLKPQWRCLAGHHHIGDICRRLGITITSYGRLVVSAEAETFELIPSEFCNYIQSVEISHDK